MPTARAVSKTWIYVLAEDRKQPVEKQTRFRLRHLSVEQRLELLNGLRPGDKGYLYDEQLGSRMLRSVRAGLVGWDNLTGPDGEPVEFEAQAGVVTDACLDRLETRHLTELAREIENGSKPTAAEVGKSAPAPNSNTGT